MTLQRPGCPSLSAVRPVPSVAGFRSLPAKGAEEHNGIVLGLARLSIARVKKKPDRDDGRHDDPQR